MVNFLVGAAGAVTGGVVVGLFVFLFRESIKAALRREVDTHVEILKHDLQREALKSELGTRQMHAVYPRLAGKIRRAEGALGRLITGGANDWEGFDEDDFSELLRRRKLPAGERKRLLTALRENRAEGELDLERVLRSADVARAYSRAVQAKNYAILRALYLSEPVRSASLGVTSKLLGAAMKAQHPYLHKDVQKTIEDVGLEIARLEELMQGELRPKASGRATA